MSSRGVARSDALGPHEAGLRLEANPDGPYDVLVGGNRIWSFNPARDAKRQGEVWNVAWPPPLLRFMNGTGHFTVAEHNTGTVLFDGDVRLGTSEKAILVADGAGHPLSIDKTGHLGRSFSERDPALTAALMQAAQRALDLLNTRGGVPAFLAFGGLLGAVRDGHLIGHDVDLDLGFVSRFRSPTDAARESFELERLFRSEGWDTWRFSADDFKVGAEGVPSAARWIDIFGGFVADDVFYLMPNVAAPESSVKILPLGEIELEGHLLVAPADPESLLAATYGPGWRVPDPSVKYKTPGGTLRRMDAWMRTAIAMRGHWSPFYGGPARRVPGTPSDFATWTAERLAPGARVIDLGCGNGRDAVYFAGRGFDTLGVDYIPGAIAAAKRLAGDTSRARFDTFNLLDSRQVLARGAQWRRGEVRPTFYGRFLLTALTDRGRAHLWLLCRMALRGGGRIYLEFRSGDEQPDTWYEFGRHFRKYLTPKAVAAEITKAGGTVEFEQEANGMAVFKDEDPMVCRMVASW